MKEFKNKVDKILEYMLIALMALMVFNVLWQVFSRFILNNPSSFTDELARYLLVWLGILGAAYVAGKKMHLAIDYFVKKIFKNSPFFVEVFINGAILLFALIVMVIGGIKLVSLTLYLHQISAALQIQLGYVYMVIPFSGIIIVFYSVANILEAKNKK